MFKLNILSTILVATITMTSTTDTQAKTSIAKTHHIVNHSHDTKHISKSGLNTLKQHIPNRKLQDYIEEHCNHKHQCIDVSTLNRAVNKASDVFDVPPRLILSMIRVESAFDKKAHNGGTVGLMQVSVRLHAKKFTGKDHYSPNSNILAGTQVVKDCLDKHKGVINKALACYNGGGDPKYVGKVRQALTELKTINIAFKGDDTRG